MDNSFKKACETFAAVSLGIEDDNIKLLMWKELLSKLSDKSERNETEDLFENIKKNIEKLDNIVQSDENAEKKELKVKTITEIINESDPKQEDASFEINENDNSSEDKIENNTVNNSHEGTENIENIENIENNEKNINAENTENNEDNKNDNNKNDNNKDDNKNDDEDGFEIDDELEWDNDTDKKGKTEEETETEVVVESKEVEKTTEETKKDLNKEMKEWTNNPIKYIRNTIREFPSPIGWNFVTGVTSKRAGKLKKAFGSDRAVFFKGADLKDGKCYFIDKEGNIAGYPDEFKEFLEKQHKLSTVDEAHLKLINISNVEELGKTMKIVPFLKGYSYVEDTPPNRVKSENLPEEFVTDTDIWEREKEYALKYSKYYDCMIGVIDYENENIINRELTAEEKEFRDECTGSSEQQRMNSFLEMYDRNTIVDMLDNLIIKFPNILSYITLITNDDELRSKYLPNTATMFKGHPTHLFGRRDDTVPSDVADTSMATREALDIDSWRKILCYITKRAGDISFIYPEVINNVTEY